MAYLIRVGESADLQHVPGPPDQTLGNQFVSVCRCGHRGRAASNPSAAYKSTQEHAERELARSAEPEYDEANDHSYRDAVDAPLGPETIEALNRRLAAGDLPTVVVPAQAREGVSPAAERATGHRGRPYTPSPSRTPSRATASNACGCGCGELCKGTFRPGHDAKLMSRLASEIRDRKLTVSEALAQLAAWPKLHAKLSGRLAAAGVVLV